MIALENFNVSQGQSRVKIWDWHNLGIRARMSVIMLIPIAMIIAVISWSYFSRLSEIQEDLEERGHLIALTLAQSSQYGVLSGNLAYLEQAVQSLLKKDKGIFRVEILDSVKTPLINLTDKTLVNNEMQMFEAPIVKKLVLINPFGVEDVPHVSVAVNGDEVSLAEQTIGYVRVTMSPSAMLKDKRNRIFTAVSIALVFLSLSIISIIFLARSLSRPLLATITALRRIREGKYDIQIKATTGGEIGLLQTTIVDMSNSLHQLRQNLEAKVAARTHDLEIARNDALKSNEEKRRLIKNVNTAIEEERKSIAVEVHDHLNASLIVSRLEAQKIYELADENCNGNLAEEIKKRSTSIIQLSNELYANSRNMIKRLRPEIIDMLGLRDAVEEMVNHYADVNSFCHFHFHAKDDFSNLSVDIAITAYRLVQESLLNIVKHAEAKKVSVHIKFTRDEKTLLLYIVDDGKGFNVEKEVAGIGLIGMRERVASFNGQIRISSTHNKGARVFIAIPIHL